MNSNLGNLYMDYKINRLQQYGVFILQETDPFVASCFLTYLTTYVHSFYYLQFDTIDAVAFCGEGELQKELEGKSLELLESLAEVELIESNDLYQQKKRWVEATRELSYFLIALDRQRYQAREEVLSDVSTFLAQYPSILDHLGERSIGFARMVFDTYLQLQQFFKETDSFYDLEYSLVRDHEDFAFVSIRPQIKVLEANYKRSLVERVYRDSKLTMDKYLVLLKKFVRNFLRDYYQKESFYQQYFIELPEELFQDKQAIAELFELVHNPFLSRYFVFSIPSSVSISQSLFQKYSFSWACIQDFSHIPDVTAKLTSLDSSGLYDYLIVSDYKAKDLDEIRKYTLVSARNILFSKDV